MLERPSLNDERIVSCLQDEYGLHAVQVAFLPLGADRNTAVYRPVTDDETPYLVKLRRGSSDETSAALPRFLGDQRIAQIIPPVATKTESLRARLDVFNPTLHPFVEGRDGYGSVTIAQLPAHWRLCHSLQSRPGARNEIAEPEVRRSQN